MLWLFPALIAAASLYDINGIYELGISKASVFHFEDSIYVLENVECDFHDHFGKHNKAFARRSYARIKDFETGEVKANISETIGFGAISPYTTPEGTLWLFGTNFDKCARHTPKKFRIDAWKAESISKWEKVYRVLDLEGVSNAVVTHNSDGDAVMITDCLTVYNHAGDNLAKGWTKNAEAKIPQDLMEDCEIDKTHKGIVPSKSMYFNPFDSQYYVFTGQHFVSMYRTKDFQTWEVSKQNPVFVPNPKDDSRVAQNARFEDHADVAMLQGFMSMQKYPDYWDKFSTDMSLCCIGEQFEGTQMVWTGSTLGERPQSPVPTRMNRASISATSTIAMPHLLAKLFEVANEENPWGKDKPEAKLIAGVDSVKDVAKVAIQKAKALERHMQAEKERMKNRIEHAHRIRGGRPFGPPKVPGNPHDPKNFKQAMEERFRKMKKFELPSHLDHARGNANLSMKDIRNRGAAHIRMAKQQSKSIDNTNPFHIG